MQKIWLEKLDWDDKLPNHLLQKWLTFLANFTNISEIRIPRWIQFSPVREVQLYCFCDDSEKAFATCIYVRIRVIDNVHTHILTAKSKVVPTKRCHFLDWNYVLLSWWWKWPKFFSRNWVLTLILHSYGLTPQLSSHVYENHHVSGCFIANRVSTIVQCVGQANWFHVDKHDNPADLATRGLAPKDLVYNDLWWKRPGFISKDPSKWLNSKNEESLEIVIEKRAIKVHVSFFKNFEDILDRFFNFSRPFRVLSYVYRFTHRICCKFKSKSWRNDWLLYIYICLKAGYPNEYKKLSNKENLVSHSQLLSFNPFIDAKGFMTVSRRLASTPDMSYDERHPIILPYKSQLSKLLVHSWYHASRRKSANSQDYPISMCDSTGKNPD